MHGSTRVLVLLVGVLVVWSSAPVPSAAAQRTPGSRSGCSGPGRTPGRLRSRRGPTGPSGSRTRGAISWTDHELRIDQCTRGFRRLSVAGGDHRRPCGAPVRRRRQQDRTAVAARRTHGVSLPSAFDIAAGPTARCGSRAAASGRSHDDLGQDELVRRSFQVSRDIRDRARGRSDVVHQLPRQLDRTRRRDGQRHDVLRAVRPISDGDHGRPDGARGSRTTRAGSDGSRLRAASPVSATAPTSATRTRSSRRTVALGCRPRGVDRARDDQRWDDTERGQGDVLRTPSRHARRHRVVRRRRGDAVGRIAGPASPTKPFASRRGRRVDSSPTPSRGDRLRHRSKIDPCKRRHLFLDPAAAAHRPWPLAARGRRVCSSSSRSSAATWVGRRRGGRNNDFASTSREHGGRADGTALGGSQTRPLSTLHVTPNHTSLASMITQSPSPRCAIRN